MLILPSIIPNSKEDLEREIKLVSSFASFIQIDVCDGLFTKKATWPYNGRDKEYFEELSSEHLGWPEWENIDIELHLMTLDPLEKLSKWVSTGISSVVVHIETVENFDEIINLCRGFGIKVGLALKPSTDILRIKPFTSNVDFIQLMGSDDIGHHGAHLEEKAVLKLKELKKQFPDTLLAVDIGVNEENAPLLHSYGADKLIVGSAILNADNPKKIFEELVNSS